MLFSTDLRLTCAPTTGWRVCFPKKRLTRTQGRVNLVNTRESDYWMSIQRSSCFFNLCSSFSSRSNKHRRDCLLPPPAASYAAVQSSPPHRTPIAGLAIPLLTHTCCYSLGTADEPVNPRTPLRVENNCVVFPGSVSFPSKASPSSTALVLSAWPGEHGQWTTSIGSGLYVDRLTTGSMAACKEMPPYYTQNNDSSTW